MMRKNRSSPFVDKVKAEKENETNDSDKPKHVCDELIHLISWNIQKVIEKDPTLNLKTALISAQDHLALNSRDGNVNIDKCAKDQQHLICALLAWQNLGNKNAESLHTFIEAKDLMHQNRQDSFNLKTIRNNDLTVSSMSLSCNSGTTLNKYMDPGIIRLNAKGPVVKLPEDTKVIMRVDTAPRKKPKGVEMKKKASVSTCLDTNCCLAETLTAMDKATDDLRKRAKSLARRESERVELLQRAELAWGDLELAYQRRLRIAEEKNEELTSQIQKSLLERNAMKEDSAELAEQLKVLGLEADEKRAALKKMQEQICNQACARLKLSEEVSKGETLLAEQQCKLVQTERDLRFKEEQAKRKLVLIENETESACALMHDAERAMHAELSGLRDQMQQVSEQLLAEDETTKQLREELEELREEKEAICQDLDGCKVACDAVMQKLTDEANEKRQELEALKDKVMECRCQFPIHVAVEVKRTPSLAAQCACAPEDRILDSCSCTSLRTTLISTLLGDLFGGLQSELPQAGIQMPCHLMKCLDDKHNWDRASVVKTNLRNFFSQLLVGELDIAIASAIENYHAKWIGASCADAPKMIPGPDDDLKQGWEQRAVERRAKLLAEQLAEQLFQERAEQLTKRAKDIVTQGPPPCKCGKDDMRKKSSEKTSKPILPCLVSTNAPFKRRADKQNVNETQDNNWQETTKDITELKNQVHALKMASINRDDLKIMEEHITNIIKKKPDAVESQKAQTDRAQKNRKKDIILKNTNADVSTKNPGQWKNGGIKKKTLETRDAINSKKYVPPDRPSNPPKSYFSRNFAVNLCLCGDQKSKNKSFSGQLNKKNSKGNEINEKIYPTPGVKSSAPIKLSRQEFTHLNSDNNNTNDCSEHCHCLRKEPSNKSIDLLLNQITKWKSNLEDPSSKYLNRSNCNLNGKCPLSDFLKDNISLPKRNANENLSSSKNLNTNIIEGMSKMHEELAAKEEKPKVINNDVINTASVYMADVNLDKSNEFINKDVNSAEYKKTIKKLVHANANNFSDLRVISNFEGKGDEDNNLNKNESTSTNLNVLNNTKSIKIATSSNYEQKLNTEKKIYDINNQISDISDLKKESNNFDYYVDFLGVTLSEVEPDNLATKPIQKKTWSQENNSPLVEKNDQCKIKISDFIKESSNDYLKKSNKKAEDIYNVQLQELQHFVANIFIDHLNKKVIPHKDVALDSRSLDGANYSFNNCVCCNTSKDGSKNLEVNTFDLLEDHLKEKFKLFKKFTCKSSCITPEAEKHIFSTILQKVKQVISDSINENVSNKHGVLIDDGSWKRVYGLLQEYLKVKLKRVMCLPIHEENVLPIILDKINNLIEHDFQRLKGICNCTQTSNANKNILPQELPKNDTNTNNNNNDTLKLTRNKDHDVNECTRSSQVTPVLTPKVELCDAVASTKEVTLLSSSNSPIILNQNTSVQVYSNILMENKCCDIKEEKVQESFQRVIYNSRSCYVKGNNTSGVFKPLKTNYIELKRSAYDRKYDNKAKSVPKNVQEQKAGENYHKHVLSSSVPQLGFSKNRNALYQRTNKHDELVPLVGTNVNNKYKNPKSLFNLKPENKSSECINKHNTFLKPTSNVRVENIDNKSIKKTNTELNRSRNDDISKNAQKSIHFQNEITRETETTLDSIDDMVLVLSELNIKNNKSLHHQFTNTFVDSAHRIDAESLVSPNCFRYKSEEKSTFPIFSNHVGVNKSNECLKSCKNDETINCQSCICKKVPVCHVKMLLNNIENDIMMSRCTCDIMSTVCPVHM